MQNTTTGDFHYTVSPTVWIEDQKESKGLLFSSYILQTNIIVNALGAGRGLNDFVTKIGEDLDIVQNRVK